MSPEKHAGFTEMFSKLTGLLDRGLTNIANKITNDMKGDFQNLSVRMEAVEHKLDCTISKTNRGSYPGHSIPIGYRPDQIR